MRSNMAAISFPFLVCSHPFYFIFDGPFYSEGSVGHKAIQSFSFLMILFIAKETRIS
jgi:hypothetical protein